MTITFDVEINASRQRVWDVLWGDASYPKWVEPFGPDSRLETDWTEGGEIRFLAGNDGLASVIQQMRMPEQMVFEHRGWIRQGLVDYDSDEVKPWAGATEAYHLTESAPGTTHLQVALQTLPDHKAMFEDRFPQALQIVKQLAETA